MTHLTDAELVDLEAKARAATPGEWEIYDSCSWRRIGIKGDYRPILQPYGTIRCGADIIGPNRDNDLARIATANPSTVIRLIAEIRERRVNG